MENMKDVLKNVLAEEIEKVNPSTEPDKKTILIGKTTTIPGYSYDVHRTRIKKGNTTRYIGVRVPTGTRLGEGGRIETTCTPQDENHEFRPMNMEGINPENANEMMERFRKTIREEIYNFLKEADKGNQ